MQEQLDLSQADFIKKIEDLNQVSILYWCLCSERIQELKDAWEAEGRVKSLKISIQVTPRFNFGKFSFILPYNTLSG